MDIQVLSDKVGVALEEALELALNLCRDGDANPKEKAAALKAIVDIGHTVLAKTLPDLKASHEIYTNTTEIAKILQRVLPPEQVKRALQDMDQLQLPVPKNAAGRPREVIDV